MIEEAFRIELASWERDEADLRVVREAVFIVEQQVPPEEEWDALDARSVHVLARDPEGRPLGTGRLTPEHTIGRVAVYREWRGRGVGDAIMRVLLEQAQALGYPQIVLHAQVDAIPFYEKLGFAVEGEEYVEAGIQHRNMRCTLPPRSTHLRPGALPLPALPPARAVDVLTLAEAQSFSDELARDARYKLWIYTRDLDRLLYDRAPFLDEVKRVALSGRGAEVLILVHETGGAVRDGHRLLHLAQRLTSLIKVRTPVIEEHRQYPSAFLLNDRGGYYMRSIGSRYEGEGNTHAPGRNRTLMNYFLQIWQHAEPDVELRQISV